MEKNRIQWLDFARTIAILLVVLTHATETIYNNELYNAGGGADLIDIIIASTSFVMGRMGVPLFLFISGFLLLGRSFDGLKDIFYFYKNHLLPLFFTNLIWVVIYNIFNLLFFNVPFPNISILIQEFLALRIVPKMWHMWFITCIFGMYLLLPVLAIMIKKLPKYLVNACVIIALILFFGIPTMNTFFKALGGYAFSTIEQIYWFAPWFCVYPVIGKLCSKKICMMAFPICLFATVSTQLYLLLSSGQLLWYNNILVFTTSLVFFRNFASISRDCIYRVEKVTQFISRRAFAIFYVHMILRHIMTDFILTINSYRSVLLIGFTLLCFALSIIIIFMLEKIEVLRRILLYIK